MPWREIFRELARQHGWTYNDIGEMTLAQIFVEYLKATSPGAEVTLEMSQVERLRSKIKLQREWWFNMAQRYLEI